MRWNVPPLNESCIKAKAGSLWPVRWGTEARGIMAVLSKRFGRYGLSLHPEKTSIIRFKRPSSGSGKDPRNGRCDFLGFTFYWAESRSGYWVIKKRTARKRLLRFMGRLWRWCNENMHEPINEQHQVLCAKLRGWFRYHGVRHNYRAPKALLVCAEEAWRYWLNRRSHKGAIRFEKFEKLRVSYPFPEPRIVDNI